MKTTLLTILVCALSVQISIAQWVLVNNGMENIGITSLTCSGNTIFAGTPTGGVYLSSDNGTTWTQTSLNDQDIRSLASNTNYIYAGSYNGNGVYRSSDNGTTWIQTSLNNIAIRALAVEGNNVYAGAWIPSTGVYKSTDNGQTWNQTSLGNFIIRSIAVKGNNVYAGSGAASGVFLSADGGATWTQTSLNSVFVGSLAAYGNIVIAGSGNSGGLFLSDNNGTTWTQNFLNNANVYALNITGNNIYVGTYNFGVYVSNDLGTSWTQRNDGLLFSGAQVYDFCLLNNNLFTGLGFAGEVGVYRRPLSELTDIKMVSNEIPVKLSLSQNYPNPFNPETHLRFGILEFGFVSLKVYSALGKEIQTLVNEKLAPGNYELEFNGSDLTSGVYFYKIQSGKFSEVKRMLLIK